MKTEQLIVELTRSLEPVEPLSSPLVRLLRWTGVSVLITVVGVLLIGPRADISLVIRQPAFAMLAMMALVTSIASAASALVLSVPGAERSPMQRGIPVFVFGAWAVMLIAMLAAGGAPLARLLALPVHAACMIEIVGFALVPGWALFAMLRRAAPLQVTWSAVLAALAATWRWALLPLKSSARWTIRLIS